MNCYGYGMSVSRLVIYRLVLGCSNDIKSDLFHTQNLVNELFCLKVKVLFWLNQIITAPGIKNEITNLTSKLFYRCLFYCIFNNTFILPSCSFVFIIYEYLLIA